MKSAKNTMKRRTIVIDGVHYYSERPHDCRKCFFWKNRKVGCSLGSENCYYLAEIVKTEQEKKCENCPYAKIYDLPEDTDEKTPPVSEDDPEYWLDDEDE